MSTQGFIGEQLGSFKLESVLGSGAMGIVFKATHQATGRQAAVKIVQGEVAENTKLLERFSREAEIVKQFRHPNIVRWLATGKYRGTYYFAMEYVEGTTLDKILQDRGALPWREVVDLGVQICDALQYAHQQGVVHRDLKPSNLMVTPDGRIKLTDFGIAKDLDRTALTAPGRTLGTAAYMAPEQIRGTPAVSHKTDLYALGALLYQMLAGQPPFTGASAVVLMHCHINEPAPRPGDKAAEVPKALDDAIVSLMAKAPADRPWDAQAVSITLNELRAKAAKNQNVSMAAPAPGTAAFNPTRAGVGVATGKSKSPPAKAARKKAKPSEGDDESGWLSRARLEVAGLVGGLLLVGGAIAYILWPPGQKYLYDHAVPLMESSRRSDWVEAIREYVDPLDSRFPDHPYRDQTRAWRDKLALDDAEGRARSLASPTPTPFSQPQTNGERQFAVYHGMASAAEAEGNEVLAERYWREMAHVVSQDNPDDRKWHLLALKRADDLAARIRDRQAFVREQLARAAAAYQSGRPKEAIQIQGALREKFGRFADVAELFGHVEPEPEKATDADAPGPDAPESEPEPE